MQLRTLFLYADSNGMARACAFDHDETVDGCTDEVIDRMKDKAQDFNPGCTFFCISLSQNMRPDITTDSGDEVPWQFETL